MTITRREWPEPDHDTVVRITYPDKTYEATSNSAVYQHVTDMDGNSVWCDDDPDFAVSWAELTSDASRVEVAVWEDW